MILICCTVHERPRFNNNCALWTGMHSDAFSKHVAASRCTVHGMTSYIAILLRDGVCVEDMSRNTK